MDKKLSTVESIYNYTDYRKFLSDYYEEAKKTLPYFSHRYIQNKIGYKSPALFSHILKNRSNLSLDMAARFAKFLKLNTKETEYFYIMVSIELTHDINAKEMFMDRLRDFKRPLEKKFLLPDQCEYTSRWYFSAVRFLLQTFKFRGESDEEYKIICKKLSPSITLQQAKDTIKLLEKFNFIQKDKVTGVYAETNTKIQMMLSLKTDTGDLRGENEQELMFYRYFSSFMELAKEKYFATPKTKRFYKTSTFDVTEDKLFKIRKRCSDFASDVSEILNEQEENQPSDRVYTLNVQLFPLSEV